MIELTPTGFTVFKESSNRELEIYNRLYKHYDAVVAAGYKPIYIGLAGSQNYKLDTAESDVDSKAIILPTLEDLIWHREPISKVISLDNGEQCDVKDIRRMWECWQKQNINFLEILFTDYYLIDTDKEFELGCLRQLGEKIAHLDPKRAIKSMYGQAKSKYAAMCHVTPASAEKIAKFGYDPKQLHHLIRFRIFAENYFYGHPFKDNLVPLKNINELIDIKSGILSYDAAIKRAEAELKLIEFLVNQLDSVTFSYDMTTHEFVSNIIYQLIYDSIKKDKPAH